MLPCCELRFMFDEAPGTGGGRSDGLLPFRFILFENICRRLFSAAKFNARSKNEPVLVGDHLGSVDVPVPLFPRKP